MNPKDFDPRKVAGERILQVIPGERRGEIKGVIKELAYNIPQNKPKKIVPLPKPQTYENRTHFCNRCFNHDTVKREWPKKLKRYEVCQQIFDRWGNPDGKRKLPRTKRR